jgi:hypothetical protein
MGGGQSSQESFRADPDQSLCGFDPSPTPERVPTRLHAAATPGKANTMRVYSLLFLLIAAALVVGTYWQRGVKIVSGARQAVQKTQQRHRAKKQVKKAALEKPKEKVPCRN